MKEGEEKKGEREEGHPDEGEKGLGPVSKVQRIVVRHEGKWLGMGEEVWCIPELFTSCVPQALPSSLPFSCIHLSIIAALERCNVESTHLRMCWSNSLAPKHLLAHFQRSWKDTSTPRCWCRPCGWGSWGLDTAAPAAASWLWSWSVSWASSCSAVSSFAWNWPWRWARPLPTRAPHLHSMRRFPSSSPAVRHRWPPASSALPPAWVYARGPGPPHQDRD